MLLSLPVKQSYYIMEILIKETAKRHGVTLKELAERLGVSRQTIYFYIDQGSKNPVNKLEEIAGAIGCDVRELFGTEGNALEESSYSYGVGVCPHCGKDLTYRVIFGE